MGRLREWARALKRDLGALHLGLRDPRVPFIAKAVAALVLAYALSPIDVIPDFIPVLGLLDDVLIVPAGIWLALRLIPGDVIAALRAAATGLPPLARVWPMALVIVAIWALAGWLMWGALSPPSS